MRSAAPRCSSSRTSRGPSRGRRRCSSASPPPGSIRSTGRCAPGAGSSASRRSRSAGTWPGRSRRWAWASPGSRPATGCSGCRASRGRPRVTPSTSRPRRVTSPASPTDSSDVEAAAIPLAGLTAWQALVDTAAVEDGSRVLILGAAGGVGHLAVQIAKARGAWVAGTSSAREARRSWPFSVPTRRSTRTSRSRSTRWTSCSTRSAARPVSRRSRRCATEGCSSRSRPRRSRRSARRPAIACGSPGSWSSQTGRGWRRSPRSSPRARSGRTSTETFPLEQAGRAHELGEQGRTRGKIVLTL